MSIEQARAYSDRSRLYLANAGTTFREQRPEKTGEFLWGAMAEALKAVAAVKDIALRNHNQIRRYARDAASELRDERLLDAFRDAQTLHSNFYEGMFDMGELARLSATIRDAVDALLELVPDEQGS